MTHAAELLGKWASSLEFEDIPESVRSVGRNCLIDTLGVAIAGLRTPVAMRARTVAQTVYSAGTASLLGSDERLSASGAAFSNGTAAHALDFDDNCYAGFVHGSAVIVPAVLAMAEAKDVSGAELLAAFVAGCEAEFAVGSAVTTHLYAKGWWNTGVLGPIGAAVAGARILRLDAAPMASAIGLATSGTGGAKACFGTDAKPVLCGRTAEAGVTAALLAGAGITGPPDAFENSRGFVHLFNDGIFDRRAFERLGRSWRMLDPGIDIKRVPVCLSAHAALDGVMDLMAAHGLEASTIRRVICEVGPIVTANLIYGEPRSVQEAQFSMPFVVGCMLVHGDVGLEHLRPEALAEPRLRAAMALVEIVTTERWADGSESTRVFPEGAQVTIETHDGRRFEHFNGFARGTRARPLSEDEIAAKFLACTGDVLGLSAAQGLLDRLSRLEALPSARDLFHNGSCSPAHSEPDQHRQPFGCAV